MDYENKYKELLARLQKAKENEEVNDERYCCVIDDIVPEIKESEDERVRKALIKHFNVYTSYTELSDGVTAGDCVAWLEKQESVGEIVERCKDSWYNEGKLQGKIEGLSDEEKYQQGWHDALEKQGEQKPVEKTEPKFNVGDWVSVGGYIILIGNIRNDLYEAIFANDEHRFFDTNVLDKEAHLWTIEDAKDGDVLATEDWIFIFEKMNSNGKPACHCHYDIELGFRIDANSYIATGSEIYPATKEQHDLLFQKMKEAGYEWNSEKKELEPIYKCEVVPHSKKGLEMIM